MFRGHVVAMPEEGAMNDSRNAEKTRSWWFVELWKTFIAWVRQLPRKDSRVIYDSRKNGEKRK
jgi:hypothetical protein